MQQLKEINRNEIVEHQKRLERHKKAIETDLKGVTTKEETAKDSGTIKKKLAKKSIVDKKARKDKQKAISEEVMGDAQKKKINIEKSSLGYGPEESKVVISKEERAERFKKLNAIAKEMTKNWNK